MSAAAWMNRRCRGRRAAAAVAARLSGALLIFSGALAAVVTPAVPARAQNAAAASGAPILTVEPGGPTAGVTALAFTPQGKLVSVGQDKVVRIFDPATGKQRQVLRMQMVAGMVGWLFAVAVDPTGELLAVGGYDGPDKGLVRIFSLADGQIRQVLRGHESAIFGLSFSRSGTLASSSGDGTVRLWNAASGSSLGVLKESKGSAGAVYAVAFSPDGSRLASVSLDKKVRIWDVSGGSAPQKPLAAHTCEDLPLTVAWSPQGDMVITGGRDRRIRFRDPVTGADKREAVTQDLTIQGLAVSQNGYMLVGTGPYLGDDIQNAQPEARAFAITPQGVLRLGQEANRHAQTVRAVALSADGKMAATADYAGRIRVWNPENSEDISVVQTTGSIVALVGWSPDASQVGWINQGDTADKPSPSAARVSFRLTGGGGPDKVAGIVDPDPIQGGAWVDAMTDRNGRRLRLSGDSTALLIEGSGPAVQIKDKNWEQGEKITAYSWTPQGDIVIGTPFRLSVYDTTGRRLANFVGHMGEITGVAVAPNGQYVASSSADQTVRIWPLAALSAGANRSDTAPMLSIFMNEEGEWVASTPQGFYSSSPRGDSLIGWHLNQGENRAAEFVSASQYQRIYDQPKVIALMFEKGSVQSAVTAIAQERKRQEVAVVNTSPTVPTVDGTKTPPTIPGGKTSNPNTGPAPISNGGGNTPAPVTPRPGGGGQVTGPTGGVNAPRPGTVTNPNNNGNRPNNPLANTATTAPTKTPVVEKPIERVEVDKVVQVDRIVTMLPPKVTVIYPKDGQEVTENQLALLARVTDPNDKTAGNLLTCDVKVRVNARQPVAEKDFVKSRPAPPGGAGGLTAADSNYQQPLVLQPGENIITIWAVNKNGIASSPIELKVTLKGAATAVPAAVVSAGGKGSGKSRLKVRSTAYVLAIGVGEYRDRDNWLEFPAKDARDFAAAWKSLEGHSYKKVDVTLLTDKDATKAAIDKAFDQMGAREYGPDDTMVVFLSGHGVPIRNTYYFAPPEFDPQQAISTGVQWATMMEALSTLPCKVVLALDTCHAGKLNVGGDMYSFALKQAAGRDTGLYLFASCLPNQKSLERADWGNGAFTRAFVAGLTKRLAADEEGLIEVEDLARFIKKEVMRETGRQQQPYFSRHDNQEEYFLAVQ